MGVYLSEMDMSHPNQSPFQLGILLINGFALMSYSCAEEPLRAANLLKPESYCVQHLCISGDYAESSSGARISASAFADCHLPFDLVLVVAGGDPFRVNNTALFSWLRSLSRQGVAIGGVSGGPVVLARAGLMNGRRMTLHWEHSKALETYLPRLMIERSLYVIDRDRLTCAGGTAPLDMMHAIITRHHGADFARRVSDWFMHTTIRLSNEPQRAGPVQRYQTSNKTVLTVLDIMESHIADPLELTQLADIAGIGVRQLNRLFREKLGKSTVSFYRHMRLEVGRNLVEQSHLSVTDIALATGFVSTAHFSRCFKTEYGLSPSMLRSKIEVGQNLAATITKAIAP